MKTPHSVVSSTHRRRRAAPAVAGLVLVALVAAGCGSEGDATDISVVIATADSATPPTAATATGTQPAPVATQAAPSTPATPEAGTDTAPPVATNANPPTTPAPAQTTAPSASSDSTSWTSDDGLVRMQLGSNWIANGDLGLDEVSTIQQSWDVGPDSNQIRTAVTVERTSAADQTADTYQDTLKANLAGLGDVQTSLVSGAAGQQLIRYESTYDAGGDAMHVVGYAFVQDGFATWATYSANEPAFAGSLGSVEPLLLTLNAN